LHAGRRELVAARGEALGECRGRLWRHVTCGKVAGVSW
jgi:hypothetical protein